MCNVFKAYDQHLNMVLGDVEETVTTVEIDEETYEEIYKVGTPHMIIVNEADDENDVTQIYDSNDF